MNKLFFLFLICACLAQAQKPAKPSQPAQAAKSAPEAKPVQAHKPEARVLSLCRLGTDPVDAARKPQWDSECIVKVPTTPVVMATGSGRQVRCSLPPLTPVVVDRQNGKALWVLQCGNPIIEPANWVPQGTWICGPEPAQPAAASAPATPAARQAPSTPAEMRVGGEVHVVHEGAVRLVHEVPAPEPAPAQAPAPASQPKKGGWWSRNAKWIIPVAIAAGAGSAVALTRGSKNNTVYYQPIPPPLYRP
jgi:hypothetical protein